MPALLTLGIPSIDEEHQDLAHRVDAIRLLLVQPQPPRDQLMLALGEIKESLSLHLKNEEALIRCWPGFDEHVAAHQRITGVLDRLMSKHMLPRPDFVDDVRAAAEYGVQWLAIHIKQEDAQFVPYILGHADSEGGEC